MRLQAGKDVMLHYKEIASPVGKLKLVAGPRGLVAVLWDRESPGRVSLETHKLDDHHPVLAQAERQLGEYFAGKRSRFELPLELRGTEFQQKVWRSLQTIPFGKTKSYMEIARAIGSPRACRAVGSASGRNPLSIVVPCHRVVGSNGALTGFAGGLRRKAQLLAHERGRAGTGE